MGSALAPSPLNTMGSCQGCKNMRPLQFVMYFRNVGMLFARRTITTKGDLCRSCIHKLFWEFTGKNVLLGPWGMISLAVTPLYLVQNTWTYTRALYKLRNAVE
jgi:hypothetical protein